ncbi:MAG: D-alanine--D-alanine ligase [Nitrosomonas sp.]|uniref:D-alanine--D-alanine ligase n=1 Tax=Nitrosomonas sp. TaxID=42353 RepID=UPI00273616BA|nr:D-alanine--D-alanine ligase [Nitrosomonas sp.]MDP1935522.1 D-alanine--D-alanine ligase [Nitrosomonas sp.]MDP3282656.1 D-alanine--D-alanine ligase [Nitrosomonas sp.]MDP3664011.1 D-alanine--D-alanine ligase [Nitrosomonas sp.]MDZ4104960.1 D-alanine--D-alanine ligase [Nitrosomonas sp.]
MIAHNFGKVAVLLGGRSAEREISLQSGHAVLDALRRGGVDAYPFDPAEQALEALLLQGFNRAFIALHGRFGEDGTIQGVLEWLGLPYTGSGVMASALAMDKWRTKLIWQATGIQSPRYELLQADSNFEQVAETLGLPLIVKPAREGSTIGLSKVHHKQDLAAAYQLAAQHDGLVLAEEFIAGTELTVAILGVTPLPVVKIEIAGELYDYEAKYFSNETKYFCPSGLPEELESIIQNQALRAYQMLGCQGWGRVDLILSQTNQLYFLEANTSPGMTSHSLVPMAARTAGISFEDLVLRILDLSHVE